MNRVLKISIILIITYTMFMHASNVYAIQGKGTDGSGGGGQTSTSNSINTSGDGGQANSENDAEWTDVFSDARKFINNGSSGQDDFDIAKFKVNIDTIYNILLTIGISLTVIVGGVLGIKFMAASAEDKAKIKEAMIPYVVGCIVIYGAFFIWKVVIMVVGDI